MWLSGAQARLYLSNITKKIMFLPANLLICYKLEEFQKCHYLAADYLMFI